MIAELVGCFDRAVAFIREVVADLSDEEHVVLDLARVPLKQE